MEKYNVIIGMEIHAELKTKSKMFCSCDNDSRKAKPNMNVCPICLGHPGTLPAVNQQALEMGILLGLALNCRINKLSKFDRKNYFYPDLPKGYQISQYDLPIAYQGYLNVENSQIVITRIHLEEDTGKLSHPKGKNYSMADYNRAGTPLVEIVTEPVIKNAHQAKEFCQKFQQILRYLNISNADMEKGEMRCEANISLQEKDKWQYEGNSAIVPKSGYKLNNKVELKNINSFKALERAIEFEIERQAKLLDKKKAVTAETRGWDDQANQTISQRIKETSADYRYFPEPDIPPLEISNQMVNRIKKRITELPDAKHLRFMKQYDLNDKDADLLISNKELAKFTEQVISELRAWIDASNDDWERQQRKLSKLTANWISSELLKHLKLHNHTIKDIKITPENFAELICLIYQNKINSSAGQMILNQMYQIGGDPSDIMKKMNLQQMDDSAKLEKIIKKVIKDNPEQAKQYKSGKTTILKFFIGQAMASSKGRANPKLVEEMLKKLLK
ncbi:MAG: Asp-tRNA(Asn)/Glu-tRNA(Gln) amidotransferase subunit GatB [bacterium]